MSSPEESQFLALLLKILNAKKAIGLTKFDSFEKLTLKILEIGVFTGYTTLALALSLPADGVIYGLDIDKEYTSVGEKYWKEAGVQDKIKLKLAPATETLGKLLEEGHAGTFDFAFIDADKEVFFFWSIRFPIYLHFQIELWIIL